MSVTTKTITVINCDLCGDAIHEDELSRVSLTTDRNANPFHADLCRHCCAAIQETIRNLKVEP